MLDYISATLGGLEQIQTKKQASSTGILQPRVTYSVLALLDKDEAATDHCHMQRKRSSHQGIRRRLHGLGATRAPMLIIGQAVVHLYPHAAENIQVFCRQAFCGPLSIKSPLILMHHKIFAL